MTRRDDVTVLIPAAGRVPEGIVANATIATPAMIPVAGRPVIQWMLASLQGLGLGKLRVALPQRGLFAEDLITDVFGRAWDVDIVVPEPGGGVADTVLDLAAGVTSGSCLAVLGDTLFSFEDPSVLHSDHVTVLVDEVEESYRWCLVGVDAEQHASGFFDKVPDLPEPRYALIGVYYFPDVTLLHDADAALRPEGSARLEMVTLLEWIRARQRIDVVRSASWLDCGNPDTQVRSQQRLLEERAFNEVNIDAQLSTITKRSGMRAKFIDEINYLRLLPPDLAVLFPRIVDYSTDWERPFVTMEFYGYPTLAELFVFETIEPAVWERISRHLHWITQHAFHRHRGLVTADDIREMYVGKTAARLAETETTGEPSLVKLLQSTQTIRLNDEELAPFRALWPWVEEQVEGLSPVDGSLIHGDLCFSNILYDLRGGICRLIDPRGSFGRAGLFGDPRYDVAKLNHSVRWLYDFIVADLFSVTDHGDFAYDLQIYRRAYHDDIAEAFNSVFFADYSSLEVDLITGLLFASMLPLHADRPDRQLAFALRSLEVLNGCRAAA